MPRGDATGPAGEGPMTGRGAGYCAGYDAPGYGPPMPGPGFGMGFGGGWGRGWRWRNRFYATALPRWARFGYAAPGAVPPAYAAPTREQELDALKRQAEMLKSQLDVINERVSELDKE